MDGLKLSRTFKIISTYHEFSLYFEKTNDCHGTVPSFVAELNVKIVVTTINPKHQRRILFFWCGAFVFDKETTVFCLQPKADGKTVVIWGNVGEWHVAKTAVGKVYLVVTRINYEKKKRK